MRMPTKARTLASMVTLAVASSLFLAACAGESTAPAASSHAASVQATSMFVPSASSKALVGVADGTYSVTFDPTRDQAFYLGPNHLSLPAYSVCNLVTSGYGPTKWNAPCTPQTLPVTLTVTIKNSQSVHPSVSFFPAMRFNPSKTVQLYMYAPRVSQQDQKNWLMLYCPDQGACINESLTDASLQTFIDYPNNVLFRRVKHFSGYVVAEDKEGGELSGGQ